MCTILFRKIYPECGDFPRIITIDLSYFYFSKIIFQIYRQFFKEKWERTITQQKVINFEKLREIVLDHYIKMLFINFKVLAAIIKRVYNLKSNKKPIQI